MTSSRTTLSGWRRVLAVTVALTAFTPALSASIPDIDWTTLEPNSILRLDAGDGREIAPLRLDLPGPGLLTLDATAAGPDLDAAEAVLLAAGNAWDGRLVSVLERSPGHLAAAVHGPGRLELRVASRNPGSATASYRVFAGFTPAKVVDDTFAPETGAAWDDERDRVQRRRFYRDGGGHDIWDKGDPEAVDPDPGLMADAEGELLLAAIATWIDGGPAPVAHAKAGKSETRSQVLYYRGVCDTATLPAEADDHPDTVACATVLRAGHPLAGEIFNPWGDDRDVFAFTLDGAAAIEVTSSGTTGTFGELLDAGGRVLATDGEGDGRIGFRLASTLTAGRYFVRVRGTGGAQGPYELSLTTRER